jgi:Protein of unknown function DUF262/Protein of unknown function (DUF1524)
MPTILVVLAGLTEVSSSDSSRYPSACPSKPSDQNAAANPLPSAFRNSTVPHGIAMSGTKIHGAEYPLRKVFSNDFNFRIPMYQRPYSWTTDEARALFEDIFNSVGDDQAGPVDNLGPYFLGSIVLIKDESSPQAEVIDGQQRLTTLTLLLSSLRHTIADKTYSAALTEYLYEVGNPVIGTQNRYRLTLRERDEDFFRKYVQDSGKLPELLDLDDHQISDSRRNIKRNAELFLTCLTDLSEGKRVRIAKYMMQYCYLIVVSTPNFDSAYRIFSILNDRGLDLSPSDILKAEIIGQIPTSSQAKYNDMWEAAEEDLGRKAFAELFSHIRMIYRKQKMRESILKEFREHVVANTKGPSELIESVLVPYAETLSVLQSAGFESAEAAEQINGLLRWLNRIDNTDWVPPAILFLTKHKHQSKSVRQFLVDLERLAAFMMLTRFSINERLDRYGKLLGAIEDKSDLYDSSSPLQLTDGESRAFLKDMNGDVYRMTPPRRLYLLLRLDSALSDGSATYEHGAISIEHVLPQTPAETSNWCSWFPSESLRDKWVHRLGNLVLLTHNKNSSASNFEFDKKKTSYFMKGGVSPFPVTTQVVTEVEWTPQVVERHQKSKLKVLHELWRLKVEIDELWDEEEVEIEIEPGVVEESVERARFHREMIPRLEKHFGGPLEAGPSQTWASSNGATVVSCQASKKYKNRSFSYWFGLLSSMKAKLEGAENSFCAFGLGEPGKILLLPYKVMAAQLDKFSTSSDGANGVRHWNILYNEVGDRIFLKRSDGLEPLDVSKYLLK